jgi:hypothetical protein
MARVAVTVGDKDGAIDGVDRDVCGLVELVPAMPHAHARRDAQ